MSKRIILMYISEVSGHHSATIAIEQAIKMQDPSAEVLNLNAFNYTNPISEKVVNQIYMGVIRRTPKIWEYLYDNPKVKKRIEKFKNRVHRANSPKLKALFDKFKPSAVACSQAFPCGMVADFKNTYSSNMPLVAVLTDYIPHSYWIYDEVDYYITPCEEIKTELVQKDVLVDKIQTLGIPFNPKFNHSIDLNKIKEELGLIEGLPTVLIMGGGQGIGPIKRIIDSLDKSSAEFQEIIITGTNSRLRRAITRRMRNYSKKITLLDFVDNVEELMSVSDMVITKPGGITTAEALTKKLPMLIVDPIPGQEESNTIYLTSKGAAIMVEDTRKMHLAVEELLSHPEKLAYMSESAAKISKPNAAMDAAKLLLDCCDRC